MTDSPELTCRPTDGYVKYGHKECDKCNYQARRLCEIFAQELGLLDVEDVADNEVRIQEMLDAI